MSMRASSPPLSDHGFVVRRPYFDRDKRVCAYEVQLRRGLSVHALDDLATLPLAGTVAGEGNAVHPQLEALGSGHPLILPFSKGLDDEEFLRRAPIEGQLFLLRPDQRIGDRVVERCQRVRDFGGSVFASALSSITKDEQQLRGIDWIGVDFRRFGVVDRQTLFGFYSSTERKLVAWNVDSLAEYREAHDLGFDRMQGLFFLRSSDDRGEIPENESTTFALLQEVQEERLDFDRIEAIICRDLSLPVRLLRYLNSARFGLRCKVESVRHALVLLGEKEVRTWSSALALSNFAPAQCPEMFLASIARGRFCEGIGCAVGDDRRRFSYFLTGLLSLLGVILQAPLDRIAASLPLPGDVRRALTGRRSPCHRALQAVRCYEEADWEGLRLHCRSLGLAPGCLPAIYWESLQFAETLDLTR